jgi:predicted nucleic acid-binding protein
VILTDTGPLIALFDQRDSAHERCVAVLKKIEEPLVTTVPVLTEAFHLLGPASVGSHRLMDFIADGGLSVWFMDDLSLARAFEVMAEYSDTPMDLADASIVTAAERENLRKVFTVDRKGFSAYRIRRGHRHYEFEVVT